MWRNYTVWPQSTISFTAWCSSGGLGFDWHSFNNIILLHHSPRQWCDVTGELAPPAGNILMKQLLIIEWNEHKFTFFFCCFSQNVVYISKPDCGQHVVQKAGDKSNKNSQEHIHNQKKWEFKSQKKNKPEHRWEQQERQRHKEHRSHGTKYKLD